MRAKVTEAEKIERLRAAGFTIARAESGERVVGSECYRCGGSGRYPSACYNGICLACRGPGKIYRSVKLAYARLLAAETSARKSAERAAERAAAEAAERAAHGGKTLREIAAEEKAAAAALVEAARLAELAKSEYLGELKERVELDATVEHVSHYDGAFGPGSVVMLRSGPHAIRWFTSSPGELGDAASKGKTFRIAGTIKKHESFRDERMTHLTRVKVVAALAEPPAPEAPVVLKIVRAAPPPPVDPVTGRCTNPRHDEVREGLYDVAGIFCAYVCSTCEAAVKARYRPGLFDESLGDYYRHAAEWGERVDPDY